MLDVLVTDETSHRDKSLLNFEQPENKEVQFAGGLNGSVVGNVVRFVQFANPPFKLKLKLNPRKYVMDKSLSEFCCTGPNDQPFIEPSTVTILSPAVAYV